MSLKQPVQYPVKYYSHLDAGAPQLADIDGNIKTILKACLVTGIGDKAGAGWESLFEDDFRIVLRRPLRTGNPPDIKIENGVINGTASHRIVSQDNPTGLNDTTELATVNFLARDNKHGVDWHLIVSDFAFVLCYQMGESNYSASRNHIMYVGSMQKIQDADLDYFVVNTDSKIGRNGVSALHLQSFLASDGQNYFKNMRINDSYAKRSFVTIDASVTEQHFNNDYAAQKIIIAAKMMTPFYCSAFANYSDILTSVVTIDGRPMLRYVNEVKITRPDARPLYIPLDYWEL